MEYSETLESVMVERQQMKETLQTDFHLQIGCQFCCFIKISLALTLTVMHF